MDRMNCSICHKFIPNPWTVTMDLFASCFNEEYERKYPEFYNPVVTVGDYENTLEVSTACPDHYDKVKDQLKQRLKEERDDNE